MNICWSYTIRRCTCQFERVRRRMSRSVSVANARGRLSACQSLASCRLRCAVSSPPWSWSQAWAARPPTRIRQSSATSSSFRTMRTSCRVSPCSSSSVSWSRYLHMLTPPRWLRAFYSSSIDAVRWRSGFALRVCLIEVRPLGEPPSKMYMCQVKVYHICDHFYSIFIQHVIFKTYANIGFRWLEHNRQSAIRDKQTNSVHSDFMLYADDL